MQSSFDNPAFWKHNDLTRVRTPDDFDVDPAADPFQSILKLPGERGSPSPRSVAPPNQQSIVNHK